MTGEALRRLAAAVAVGREPTDTESGEAFVEAITLVVDGFADLKRIADAATNLVGCKDESVAFRVYSTFTS